MLTKQNIRKTLSHIFIHSLITYAFLVYCNLTYAKFDFNNIKGNQQHPSVEDAFTVNAYIKNENQIQIIISAIPNTYIYQNSLKFTSDNTNIQLHQDYIQFPNGKIITDEHYGKTKVFNDNFEIIVPYQSDTKQKFQFTIEYQGCLKDILCYPPNEKIFSLTALASIGDINPQLVPMPGDATLTPISDQNKAVELLNNAKILSIIGGFFLFGLLLSLTPCVLPMVPIISGIIAGHKHNMTKQHAFMLSFVYVLSMALTYMLAGILVASAGVNLTSSLQQPLVIIIVSSLFIFLAIASFGYIELKLPDFITQKLANTQSHQKGGTYLGVVIIGILSALVISPCATAPLSGALLYISSTGNAILGGLALFSMGFAMGMPILLFGTSAGHFLPKAGPWMKEINIFFGVVFIAMALFLLSRIITGPLNLILWAFLLIFYAVHLGLLEPAQHGWQRIQKGFALIIAIYGSFLLAGATQNQTDVLHPFGNIVNNSEITTSNNLYSTNPNQQSLIEFTKIKDINELKNELALAKKNKKITMVDFYADWCSSCRLIEKNVFTDPNINAILNKFNRIKVDLTHYSEEDKKIMNQLSVFNPPTFIFYDPEGNEIKNTRIVGEIDVKSFYEFIKKLISA